VVKSGTAQNVPPRIPNCGEPMSPHLGISEKNSDVMIVRLSLRSVTGTMNADWSRMMFDYICKTCNTEKTTEKYLKDRSCDCGGRFERVWNRETAPATLAEGKLRK